MQVYGSSRADLAPPRGSSSSLAPQNRVAEAPRLTRGFARDLRMTRLAFGPELRDVGGEAGLVVLTPPHVRTVT